MYYYDSMNQYEILKSMLSHSHNIVFFTGAGISVPSGIPDFRSADGLYNQKGENYPPETIISHSFYMAHKEEFYEFYKKKMMYPDAKPNIAHKYIAELEKEKHVTVVTQNIDGLHQEAGSTNVIELHGSIKRNYCEKCGQFYDDKFVNKSNGIPKCTKCGGDVKPDVVLYEEQLDMNVLDNSIRALTNADLLIVAGTSLSVYPASGLIRYYNGENIVVINKDKLDIHFGNVIEINRPVGEVFSQLDR